MKKTTAKSVLPLLMLMSAQYADAAIGTKIKSALNNVGTELVVIGAGVLFIAIVLIAINAFFTPIQHLKRWVGGCLVGGVLLIFAEDIVSWILSLSGSGSGF